MVKNGGTERLVSRYGNERLRKVDGEEAGSGAKKEASLNGEES